MKQTLQQSGQVRLWNPRALPQVLSAMGKTAEQPVTPPVWREIALREGQQFVAFLSGSTVGDGYSLNVRLEQVLGDPARPWKSWQNSFQANSRDQIFRSVDEAARWLRESLGEPAAEIAESASPERVTTPSWPALREFHSAERLIAAGQRRAAIAHLNAALRHDPQFTMALYRKGDVHVSLSENEEGYRAWMLALDSSKLRPLSKREDLKLRGMLASDTADYQTAERLFREYAQRFPDEMYGHYYRISPLQFLGRSEESLVAADTSLRFNERKRPVLMHRLFGLLPLGRFDEALGVADRLDADGAREWALEARGMTAYAQGQSKAAFERYEAAVKLAEPQRASQMRLYQAFILADAGERDRAIAHLREYEKVDAKGFRAELAQ
jgi:tetratricopeptide (TPR) repeat protein